MIKEFRTFLLETNALALAVGVIIGGAIGKVVGSIVADILMPILSLAFPGGNWREAKIVLSTATDAAGHTSEKALLVGNFIGSIVDFLIVAAAVFLITKAMLRPAPAAPAPATKTCPECLETIPQAAKRCRACTSPV